jgi:sulfite reductase (ferredoxin)
MRPLTKVLLTGMAALIGASWGTGSAAAGDKMRVCVVELEGARNRDLQNDLTDAIRQSYQILGDSTFYKAAKRMRMGKPLAPANLKRLAKFLKLGAVIDGTLVAKRGKYELLLRVRDARTGAISERIRHTLRKPRIAKNELTRVRRDMINALERIRLDDGGATSGPGPAPKPKEKEEDFEDLEEEDDLEEEEITSEIVEAKPKTRAERRAEARRKAKEAREARRQAALEKKRKAREAREERRKAAAEKKRKAREERLARRRAEEERRRAAREERERKRREAARGGAKSDEEDLEEEDLDDLEEEDLEDEDDLDDREIVTASAEDDNEEKGKGGGSATASVAAKSAASSGGGAGDAMVANAGLGATSRNLTFDASSAMKDRLVRDPDRAAPAGQDRREVFAETRLRRGAYGQRYDNGQRHDGSPADPGFPCGELTKGPRHGLGRARHDAHQDPDGRRHLRAARDARRARRGVLRLDPARHHAAGHPAALRPHRGHAGPDAPAGRGRHHHPRGLRQLVRNVTAASTPGVCARPELRRHPLRPGPGPSSCSATPTPRTSAASSRSPSPAAKDDPCGLANIHDIGAIAWSAVEDGVPRRAASSLRRRRPRRGAAQAKLLSEFVPEEELLPVSQAVCRVFARLGERKNRARARLKFVVAKLGIEEFRRLVAEERAISCRRPALERLPRGSAITDDGRCARRARARARHLDPRASSLGALQRLAQAQEGYAVATIRLPLGDLTSEQTAQAHRHGPRVHRRHRAAHRRAEPRPALACRGRPAGLLRRARRARRPRRRRRRPSPTSPPAPAPTPASSASPRPAAWPACSSERLAESEELTPDVEPALRIKASGCFNSCGQHHIADIGFLGVSRNVGGRRVAHFQLVVGGQWQEQRRQLRPGHRRFPSKRIPRSSSGSPPSGSRARAGRVVQGLHRPLGRAGQEELDDLREVPAYEDDPSFYRDWADAREYTIGDMGAPASAPARWSRWPSSAWPTPSARSSRPSSPSTAATPRRRPSAPTRRCCTPPGPWSASRTSTSATTPDHRVSEFRTRFHDTGLFHDPFAGAKFAAYLFRTHESPPNGVDREQARQQIEEASCSSRPPTPASVACREAR